MENKKTLTIEELNLLNEVADFLVAIKDHANTIRFMQENPYSLQSIQRFNGLKDKEEILYYNEVCEEKLKARRAIVSEKYKVITDLKSQIAPKKTKLMNAIKKHNFLIESDLRILKDHLREEKIGK